jgi:hypothetical protein
VISTGASGDNRFDLTAARRPCHCSSVERGGRAAPARAAAARWPAACSTAAEGTHGSRRGVCVDVGKRAGSCRAPRRPARLVAARGGVRSCAPRLGASGLDSRGFSSPVASFGASGGFGRLGGGALALSWLLPGTSGLLERATSASTTTSTVPVSVNGLVKRRIAVDSIWET